MKEKTINKILEFITLKGETTPKEISKETKISYPTVLTYTSVLVAQNKLSEKRFGNARVLRCVKS